MTVTVPSLAPSAEGVASLTERYRAWRSSELGQITDRIEEALILRLIGPAKDARVLDIGCGDGALCARLAALGADVTGLDADPHMLAAARERARQARAAFACVRGDVRALPFADDTFDVVVAVTVLCLVSDAALAVREMARVLRPGGRLVFGELGRYSLWAIKRQLSGLLGSTTWRSASFRSASELRLLVSSAGCEIKSLEGAIYYPPCGVCARWLEGVDHRLGAMTTTGAAFLALAADKCEVTPGSASKCE